MSLVTLIVAILLFALLWYLIGMFPDAPQLVKILRIVLIVVAIIWLLEAFGIFTGPILRVR